MQEKKDFSYYVLVIWLSVALALAGVALIAINLHQNVQAEGEKAFHQNLESISESSAKSIELFMERIISDLVLLTQLEVVKEYDVEKTQESFSSVMLKQKGRISHLMLLDAAGEGVAAVVNNGPEPSKLRMDVREFFRETMKGWRVNMSPKLVEMDSFRGILVGTPIFRRAKDDQEGFSSAIYKSGMVIAILSVDELVGNFVRPIRIEKSGFAWLRAVGGRILGDGERLDGFTRAVYGNSGSLTRLTSDFSRALEKKQVDGWVFDDESKRRRIHLDKGRERWLLSVSNINILDQVWTLAVAAPRFEVTYLLETSFYHSVMLVSFVVVIMLSGGYLLTRVNRRLVRAEEKALLASELEEKNRTLEDLNRRMDEFVSVVSHDIRSPLNVIKGFVNLIRSSPDGGKFERETTNMLRSCKRLVQLTGDILDMAKLEGGKIKLAYDPIVIDNIVWESVQTMEFATKEKKLRTVIDLGEETQMEGDSGKLLQVMNNLIGNAVKFTPQGGTITISKEASNGNVVIKVSDTGPGIDTEDQGIVFSKFEQVRRHQLGVEPGSGLGLSICKSIVELHGGTIGVASAPGKGSTFHVSLPVRRPAPEESAIEKEEKL